MEFLENFFSNTKNPKNKCSPFVEFQSSSNKNFFFNIFLYLFVCKINIFYYICSFVKKNQTLPLYRKKHYFFKNKPLSFSFYLVKKHNRESLISRQLNRAGNVCGSTGCGLRDPTGASTRHADSTGGKISSPK